MNAAAIFSAAKIENSIAVVNASNWRASKLLAQAAALRAKGTR